MATTGHESEAINVQGLKASLQKLKTDHIDGKAAKSNTTAGSYNKVTVNSQGIVTAGENPTTLAGHGITDAYTKTEVNGLVDTPHQEYVTVQATSQTTAATDVLPNSGQAADTIYRVSNWDGSANSGAGAFDVTKYSEYAWDDVSSPNKYVFLCVKSQIGEVFDISVYNNNAVYANLTAALGTNGANVPESLRKGGMSVKFIQGTVQSNDNKYVQWRYMGTSTANADFTNEANWGMDKLSFIKTGTNLFDKNSVVKGIIAADGTISSGSKYRTSDFIPVTAGKTYIFACDYLNKGMLQEGRARAYLCYDSSKTPLTGTGAYLNNSAGFIVGFTAIENTSFVRVSFSDVYIDTMVFSDSDQMNFIYENYRKYVDENNLPNVIDGSKINKLSLSLEKLSFVDKFTGKNLFDKNANLVTDKYYIQASGILSNNDTYFTSDFIEIDPTKNYILSNNGKATTYRYATIYGENKLPLENGCLENQSIIPATVGAKYVRFSAPLANKDSIQFEEGSSATAFEAYYCYYKIKRDALPPLIVDDDSVTLKKLASTNPVATALGVSKNSAAVALSSGDSISLTDFPLFTKKNVKISFMADITTMGTFYIGRGYQSRSGKYIKVDATNITPITCDMRGNESEGTAIPHELTISTFVKVILDVRHIEGHSYKCNVELQSIGGRKVVELTQNWCNSCNAVFVKSAATNGLACTNGSLNAVDADLRKEVWLIGDSYLSLNDSGRLLYYIEELGYYNYLVDALSGGGSNVYADAVKLLGLGSPKYLVWCLGMNYGSDADANTPNSTWKNEVDNIISLCNTRGITPILATIPCVPGKSHEGKNKYVKDSGYRYIDFARAVHGETYTAGVDNWYEGYLNHGTEQNPDNIHPTALGAQALATQCLSDFPEIMEY